MLHEKDGCGKMNDKFYNNILFLNKIKSTRNKITVSFIDRNSIKTCGHFFKRQMMKLVHLQLLNLYQLDMRLIWK